MHGSSIRHGCEDSLCHVLCPEIGTRRSGSSCELNRSIVDKATGIFSGTRETRRSAIEPMGSATAG